MLYLGSRKQSECNRKPPSGFGAGELPPGLFIEVANPCAGGRVQWSLALHFPGCGVSGRETTRG